MGKTRLAARFAAEAHAGGATVLHGRIDEETVVPYQPFVEALRHYAAHAGDLAGMDVEALAPLVPELGGDRRRSPASARTAATGCSRPSPRCSAAPPASARCCSSSRTSSGRGSRRCCCSATSSAACTARPLLVLVTAARRGGRTSSPTPRGMLADLSREHAVERIALARPRGGGDRGARRRRRARRAACTAAPPATRSSSRRCCAASPRRPRSRPACPRASRTSSRAGSRGSSPAPSRR